VNTAPSDSTGAASAVASSESAGTLSSTGISSSGASSSVNPSSNISQSVTDNVILRVQMKDGWIHVQTLDVSEPSITRIDFEDREYWVTLCPEVESKVYEALVLSEGSVHLGPIPDQTAPQSS